MRMGSRAVTVMASTMVRAPITCSRVTWSPVIYAWKKKLTKISMLLAIVTRAEDSSSKAPSKKKNQ